MSEQDTQIVVNGETVTIYQRVPDSRWWRVVTIDRDWLLEVLLDAAVKDGVT